MTAIALHRVLTLQVYGIEGLENSGISFCQICKHIAIRRPWRGGLRTLLWRLQRYPDPL